MKHPNKTTGYFVALLIAILLIAPTKTYAQSWITQNPKPTYQTLWDVSFPSADTGYVAGNNSTLFRTTDGGESWEKLSYPTPDWQIRGINFINNNTGFITREHGVYKTTDGGETWDFVDIDIITGLEKTWFLNDTVGFAFGFYSAIAKTIDGGESWEVLSFSFNEENYYDAIGFADLQTGYIVGKKKFTGEEPVCRRTTDGGHTWTNIEVSARIETVKGLAVLGPEELWIGAGNSFPNPDTLGADALAFHSVDGGGNWHPYVVGLSHSSMGVEEIEFLNPDEGRILNRNHLYTTNDGGQTWNDTYQNGTENQYWTFSAFDCLPNETIYFAGNGPTLVKTTDLGLNFTSLIEGPTNNFNSIFFTDTLHGCVGGHKQFGMSPSIFYTEDGGANWLQASFDTTTFSTRIADLAFVNSQTGWAVGFGDTPCKTNDGGKTWTYKPTGFDHYFKAISIPDGQHIFIATYEGNVIMSDDQGNLWQDISPGVANQKLEGGFTFVSPATGYIALREFNTNIGKLLKTSDGGANWTEINYVFDDPLVSLSFADADHGIISLSNGQVLATADGGSTWSIAEITNSTAVEYLKLFDENTGVATIAGDFVAITSDGGQTFETVYAGSNAWPSPTRNSFFLDEYTGWGCSSSGMIAKYTAMPTTISENEPSNTSGNKHLHIYPNPTSGKIHMDEPEITTLHIFSLEGVLIKLFNKPQPGEYDLSGLRPGIYILKAETGKGIFSSKLIKR